ncbi:hypothetical protein M9Y10_022953 [Tritrichomonas musculus]|uniref:Uncharacterized protein n=1 Tax=Tritrichomonas musculus TaxID=1915356 RepID=A0ABR2KTR7_9EUKA
MSEPQQNKETLNLISQGVQLKKVDRPPERKLPTAAEIAEAKKRAETEGPEIDPENLPKAGDGRSMLELIKEEHKLKKVETKCDRKLPTAAELAEAKKRAETEGPEIDPENLPKAGDGRSMLELIKEEHKLKPVQTKEPRLPTAQEIEEQKKLEENK